MGALRMIALLVAFFLLAGGLFWFSVQVVGDNILGLQFGWMQGFLISVATILSLASACGPRGGTVTVIHLAFGSLGLVTLAYLWATFDRGALMPWPYFFTGSLAFASFGHFLPRDSKGSVDTSDLNIDLMS